jgi:hypothetical protein
MYLKNKVWGLDQIVRILAGDKYDSVVEEFEADTEGKWDIGLAP